jgi:polygalacturonase
MYTKRQEAWVNKPAVPSLIDADVANWWEAGIYGAHVGLAALAVRAADYGVVGDGVADDTTAFTAALAAAAEAMADRLTRGARGRRRPGSGFVTGWKGPR